MEGMYSNLSIATVVASAVIPLLAALAVALRLQARKIKKLPLYADDYFIAASLIACLALCALSIVGATTEGIGAPLEMLLANRPLMIRLLKVVFADVLLSFTAVALVKVSVVLFYKRIFVSRSFLITANLTIGILVVWYISIILGYIFAVLPVSNRWDPIAVTSTTKCSIYQLAGGSTDIALDLFTLCLPLPVIKNLQMSTQRKFKIAGIFWLGSFCVISSSVRLYYIVKFSSIDQQRNPGSFSSTITSLLIWSRIEPCASVIAACLPTYGPLFERGNPLFSLYTFIRFSQFSRGDNSKRFAGEDSESQHSIMARRTWAKLDSSSSNKEVARPTEMKDLE